jgi:gamma-glutamyltranspeptidase/glutathione hydrolase
MRVHPQALLSDDYIARRRALISETAIEPKVGAPSGSHTVYLAAADADGNMISYIQSNYAGFGSGIVVPGTGIALQNRGANFSLDPRHHNVLEPGKRTFHTIIPGFLSKAGQPVGPFGVMGGFIQPQAHLQVVANTVDFGLNPQAALDAPRWNWLGGKRVGIEQAIANPVAMGLIKRGHDIRIDADSISFGRGQIIWRDPVSGVLAGGSEPRTDGIVASW